MTIHFICAGNTYRSRLAEAYLKSLQLPGISVISSGHKANADENGPMSDYVFATAQRAGIEKYFKRHWDQLTQDRLDKADLTICMNREVYKACKKLCALPLRTQIWDIADLLEHESLFSRAEKDRIADKTLVKIKKRIDELANLLTRPVPEGLRDVLTEDGTKTGKKATIEEINEKGLWHAGVHVGLFTEDRKVLLQKRSENIIMRPGAWALGAGGGVDSGETPAEAAVRECFEELGLHIKPNKLMPLFTYRENRFLPKYGFHDRCIVSVFSAKIPAASTLHLQSEEVADCKILARVQAEKLLEASGYEVTPYSFNGRLLDALETLK